MTPTFTTAHEFLAWQRALLVSHEEGGGVSRRNQAVKAFKALPRSERLKVLLDRHERADEYFIPENARPEHQREHASPSGRWRLVTTPYGTKPNSWNYTLGEVYRVSLPPRTPTTEGEKVAEVRRNYSSLWFAWVENHKVTGHDYLLTGEDYQGFTVVNLSTGTVTSHVPDEAYEGHGWCPTSAEVLPDGVTLKVSGCYWACPYEVRLYDFTNPDAPDFPLDGLPNLTADLWFDEDENTTLSVGESGEVTLTQHRKRFRATGEWEWDVEAKRTLLHERAHKAKKHADLVEVERVKQEEEELGALYYPEDDDEHDAAWEKVPYTREVYARSPEGAVRYAELPDRKWKSEHALRDEQKRAESEQKQREVFQTYADTEPLYQLAKGEFPDCLSRTGKQYPSLVNRWDGDENPFYFHVRVHERTDELQSRTANLVWGAVDGPVKAECWTYGKGMAVYLFPRTHDGWREALAHARAHISDEALQEKP